MTEIKTYLGIDFGKSKIGLAIADEETRIAFTFDVLKNDNEFWKNLKEICQSENVTKIIVGKTSHAIDKESSDEKEEFGAKVFKETGVEVEFQEEMFTTKIAQQNLIEKGGREISKMDDSEAARIILQSWLDKKIKAN